MLFDPGFELRLGNRAKRKGENDEWDRQKKRKCSKCNTQDNTHTGAKIYEPAVSSKAEGRGARPKRGGLGNISSRSFLRQQQRRSPDSVGIVCASQRYRHYIQAPTGTIYPAHTASLVNPSCVKRFFTGTIYSTGTIEGPLLQVDGSLGVCTPLAADTPVSMYV